MFRAIDKWLLPYLKRRPQRSEQRTHVMIAICDHFEPLHHSNESGARKRIARWEKEFPKFVEEFRDPGGHPPKHTFFYPAEQYSAALLDPLAGLCRKTGSEVEVHLHHDGDTEEGVRAALEEGKMNFREHGLLPEDASGQVRFAFIHGNWALNHSHPEGKGCGVEREIPILRRAGCYADFTMPSAPSPTQARFVNGIGYLRDLPGRRALDEVEPAISGEGKERRENENELLMIQGPLALNWQRRKWGILPRVENGDLTGANPPTASRFRLAFDQAISVERHPDWVFIKFHTHGGIERNFEMLLGEPMRRFHESLSRLEDVTPHYVTAREMANLVHAAEDGRSGDPDPYRDYCFQLPQ
ncbi:MAG: hypothetical protein P1U85_17610 [Verrucomicrobiales bacterium]|nr:hypothetical protein [Verrucomicrobiales bacterium]